MYFLFGTFFVQGFSHTTVICCVHITLCVLEVHFYWLNVLSYANVLQVINCKVIIFTFICKNFPRKAGQRTSFQNVAGIFSSERSLHIYMAFSNCPHGNLSSFKSAALYFVCWHLHPLIEITQTSCCSVYLFIDHHYCFYRPLRVYLCIIPSYLAP